MEYYEPEEFADDVRSTLGNDLYSATRDYFEDDAVLSMLEPYPERSAMWQFMAWFADGVLYEMTTDVEPELAPLLPKQRKRRFSLLPIEEAMLRYEIKDDGFNQFISDTKKSPEEVDGDDVYDYFQALRECGTIEELSSRMADAAFPVIFEDLAVLATLQEAIAERIRDLKSLDMDVEHALMFESKGVLRKVPPPRWALQMVIKRDRAHCAACAAATSFVFEQLVGCEAGGLNDVGNLRLKCAAQNL